MSVESKLYVGLTVELERNVDFKHVSEFTKKHPELADEAEGKLALVGDGMNGDFLRLIYIDKFVDGGCLGESNDFIELAAPKANFNLELFQKMSDLYEEYTGKEPSFSDFKYAMWNMWY